MSVHLARLRRLLAGAVALPLLLGVAPVMAKTAAAPVTSLPHVARRIAHAGRLRVVAFGSSSTEGVGATSPAATYPARLEALLRAELPVPVEVINAGIGGEDADDMLRRLPDVLAFRPDLVIWQTGSNDPLRAVPLDRFEAKTRQGIIDLRAGGADVMLMEPQDCDVLHAHPGAYAYRDTLRAIAARMQVPLVRRYDLMQEWLAEGLLTRQQMLWHDGLHMTDGGYEKLAEAVGAQIMALLARRPGTHLAGAVK